jgi:hypothetical protein
VANPNSQFEMRRSPKPGSRKKSRSPNPENRRVARRGMSAAGHRKRISDFGLLLDFEDSGFEYEAG